MWKNSFKEGKELVVATSAANGTPNANKVISLGFLDDKLLIANVSMRNTIKNLMNNRRVCIVGGYFRIKGSALIMKSGKYFEYARAVLDNQNKKLRMNDVIIVNVKKFLIWTR